MSGSMLYDSEYDNYGPSSLASDGDPYENAGPSGSGQQQQLLGQDRIRRVSQHITRSFGQQHQSHGSNNLSSSSGGSDSEDV